MNVVQIRQSKPCQDVVATLRNIADEIEAGSLDWPVSTAVLICGHSDGEVPLPDGSLSEESFWTTYAMGPRCGSFTVRGLVMSALCKWNHGDD